MNISLHKKILKHIFWVQEDNHEILMAYSMDKAMAALIINIYIKLHSVWEEKYLIKVISQL